MKPSIDGRVVTPPLVGDWPYDPQAPVRPTDLSLRCLDSGVVCESCGMHVTTDGQCRCSA